MATKQSGLNNNNNDDDNSDNSFDTLPADTLPNDSESELSSSPPPSPSSPDRREKGTWGALIPLCQKQLDEHDHDDNRKLDKVRLTKNQYTAGRLKHLDIHFNEENTDFEKLASISETQFIITRERVTNYETANYKGDFVVVIYDKSTNGTFINEKELKDKKCILLHNDTISIVKPDYKVFRYKQKTVNPIYIPPKLAKNYVALRILGHGVCGPVKLIVSKINYCPFALKCLKRRRLDETADQDILNKPDRSMNEVNILRKLEHLNVMKMIHMIKTSSTFCIILELMQGGELYDRVKKNGGLSEKLTKFYFYQIVTAVEYLHGKGITHRDLKPANILLQNNDEYTLLKVTDFGVSKMFDDKIVMKSLRGTKYFLAPEMYLDEEKRQYTSQVDVWSLGVILYYMLSNHLPFTEKDNKNLPDVVIKGIYDYTPHKYKNVSDEAKHLIGSMLKVDPNDRYTAPKILAHLWFDDTEVMEKISKILEPYINVSNNDNSGNKRPNIVREIGSPQRDDKFSNDIPIKRHRLE